MKYIVSKYRGWKSFVFMVFLFMVGVISGSWYFFLRLSRVLSFFLIVEYRYSFFIFWSWYVKEN